ncbi:hypothetical protein WOLCODRAFT_158437 [Wolfiporia cocos MD-104 SS10]|uniref:Uncharacterized protein n=1 Tax=Wolfiporia cocos (strain MD-104) TaxID=742152 RepID=A0A2H3J9M9_WOLCO|nr:hypothetical protein WOLCODRAFT_158437 [Wolfiporia cocos MD-104 SS10]
MAHNLEYIQGPHQPHAEEVEAHTPDLFMELFQDDFGRLSVQDSIHAPARTASVVQGTALNSRYSKEHSSSHETRATRCKEPVNSVPRFSPP